MKIYLVPLNLTYTGKLNADEARQLVSGNTLELKHVDDAYLKTRFYASDGTFLVFLFCHIVGFLLYTVNYLIIFSTAFL